MSCCPPANAVETTSFNAALVIGPALAGTLSALGARRPRCLVEAALALAALALIVRYRASTRRRSGRTSARSGASPSTACARSSSSLQLRGVTAAAAFGMAGLGLLTVAFPLFAVDHLGVERSASGYMWAAFAVGSTLGALSLVRIQRRFPPERIVVAGYATFGLLMLDLAARRLAARVPGPDRAGGDGRRPALAAQFAVRQQYVPPSLYGQVFTSAVGVKVGSFALGAALAGAVVTGLGSAEALVVAATLQIVAAVVGVTLMVVFLVVRPEARRSCSPERGS